MCLNIRRKKSISFLLGSGFSVPLGYPTGKELGEKIYGTPEEDLEKIKGEYGHLTNEKDKEYLQCIKSFIDFYKKEINTEFNYEDFYDLICGCEYNTIGRSHGLMSECNLLFQQLVKWHLKPQYASSQCPTCLYKDFINFIKDISESYQINLHTLNHDTLLEKLLSSGEITFDDGFCDTCDEKYYHNIQDNSLLKHYTGTYDGNIQLYKLHGSIDYYLCGPNGTDKIDALIKTHSRGDIVKSKTPILTEEYEMMCDNYLPSFLTGQRTKINYYNFFPYNSIYDKFSNNLSKAEKLVIIGYSGKDLIINKEINQLPLNKIYIIDCEADKVARNLNLEKSSVFHKKDSSISKITTTELRDFIFSS